MKLLISLSSLLAFLMGCFLKLFGGSHDDAMWFLVMSLWFLVASIKEESGAQR